MKMRYLLLVGVLASSAAMAQADVSEPQDILTKDGMVNITWQQPDSYRDIKAGSDIQSRFDKRLFNALTASLNKQAEQVLKTGQSLELTVTNLDLAGDMRPTFGATANDLRVVKNIYPPRISFSYKLLSDGKVMVAGTENLSDMNFLGGIQSGHQKAFHYEAKMLDKWLEQMVKTVY